MVEEEAFDDIDPIARLPLVGKQVQGRWQLTDDNIQRLQALRASVPPEVQKELYSLPHRPDAARQRIVELAAEKGVTLTVEQVREFLKQMHEESEFDDIELDPIALMAIAGGTQRWQGS